MLAKFKRLIAAVTTAAMLPAMPLISRALPETTAIAQDNAVWSTVDDGTKWSLSASDRINGYANVENGTIKTTIVADDETNLYESDTGVQTAFNDAQFKSAAPTLSTNETNPNIMGVIAQAGDASNYLFKANVKYTLHYIISGNWTSKVTNTPNGSYVNVSIWQDSSHRPDNWTGQKVVSKSPETDTEMTYDFTPTVDGYAQFTFELRRVTAGSTMTVSNIYVTTDTEMYTVTFDSNGGSSVPAQQVLSGQTADEPEPPTRDGCTFKGWTLNGEDYTFTEQVTSDIELVAQWESITGDTLAEEKIDLTDKKIYLFTIDNSDKKFHYNSDVTNDDTYKILTDGNYNTDANLGANHYVMIDLGDKYPISTIKAYQNDITTAGTNGNFAAVLDDCSGTESVFVKADLQNLIRTHKDYNPLTTEHGASCFTYSQLASERHNMGSFRYIILYNGGNYHMNMSELEIYKDTTVKKPYLSVRNFYGDHMVLQRGKPHVIKGYSSTGTSVSVTMSEDGNETNTQTVTAIPDESGSWTAELDPMTAGMTPYTITVSDDTEAADVTLTDVLVGDVFLASGQSNMAYDAPKTATQKETQYNNVSGPEGSVYYKKGMYELQRELANENIRMFKMRDDTAAESGLVTENVPVWIDWCKSGDMRKETNSAGVETEITHESILALSSLAAFFADKVREDEDIPVGVIQASRGGSAINIWSEGGRLYNNHIAPLDGLNIAGILWYQGCANSNETGFKTYYNDFKGLIKNYRQAFNDDTLPFLYVQLAPYKNDKPEYESAGSQRFQVMREIQREMLNDSEVNTNLYMAVSMDTTQDSHHDKNGNVVNQSLIHPLGKDTLGRRMAAAYEAMAKNDNETVVSGPLVDAATADGNTITVTFKDSTANGLKVLNPDYSFQCDGTGRKDTDKLEEFKIAGADGVYYDATATIEGETVKVTSDKVPAPKYVSYAYSELPANPNLANGADLPASPFNIGLNGAAAPTAPPETKPGEATPSPKPTTAPTHTPEPSAAPTPDAPVFTTAPDDTIPRGVEEAIADIEIPQDKSMQFADGDNVAIIGDSITNMDFYSSFLTELYAAKKPDAKVKFYNMGVGGNTALLGLQMLDKEFSVVKDCDNVVPNKAVIMFGMNDSSLISIKNEAGKHDHYQSDEENIAVYKENMTKLLNAVRAKGVTDITIMSSSPYDDTMESNIIEVAPNKEGARGRLMAYAKWLETFAAENDCHFINLTEPMYALLDKYQESDPTRTFINPKDRVHPQELGGFVMMYIIAKAHGLDGINSKTEIDVSGNSAQIKSGTAADAGKTDHGVTFTYTPSKNGIAATYGYFEANRIVPLTKDFNQEIIQIDGLADGYYDIDMDGFKVGPYTAAELQKGINLAVIPNSPIARRSEQVYGDMFAAHKVNVDYIRNIRCAEKKAMQAGRDIMDDAAVKAYVESTTDENLLLPQYRNKYLEYKDKESELYSQYAAFIDKMYADANKSESVQITVSAHTPQNETPVFCESFSHGVGLWKPMMIGSNDNNDYGTTECDYVTGSDLTDGSGAGSAKITIGINKARNYYTLANHIPVLGGMKLDVSSSVMTDSVRDGDTVDMSVIFCDKDDKVISGTETKISDNAKGTHGWQEISGSVTVPDNAYYMRLDISARCMTNGAENKQGTAWFDDVRVISALQNADFEEASDGAALAWTAEYDENGSSAPQNNIDTENKVSGSQSLIIKGGDTGVTYSSEPVIVAGGQKYLLSAYAKKDAAASGTIGIEAYNAKGQKLDAAAIDVTSAEFTKTESVVTMPENTVYAVIKLHAENGNMNADNIGLSPITGERDTAYGFTQSDAPVYLDVLGAFANKLTVEKIDGESGTTLVITSKNDEALPKLTLYTAVYTADNALRSVSKKEYAADTDGKIRIPLTAPQDEYYKIMLWDGEQAPVIRGIQQKG